MRLFRRHRYSDWTLKHISGEGDGRIEIVGHGDCSGLLPVLPDDVVRTETRGQTCFSMPATQKTMWALTYGTDFLMECENCAFHEWAEKYLSGYQAPVAEPTCAGCGVAL